MASNPRPTTEIHLTYGTLSTSTSARTLNPVMIAPRYAVHSYLGGDYAPSKMQILSDGVYEDVYYDHVTGNKEIPWPARSDNSIIDTASAMVYAERPFIQLNTAAVKYATRVTGNAFNINGYTVKPVGNEDVNHDFLRGFSVQVGDKVELRYTSGQGSESFVANITGILPTMAGTVIDDPTYVGPLASSPDNGIVVGDKAKFTGGVDAVYLMQVTAVNTNSISVLVTPLAGDSSYKTTIELGPGDEVAIGRFGATVSISGDTVAGFTVGDSWSMQCHADDVAAYDIIYIDAIIPENATLIEALFSSNRYSPDYVALNTAQVHFGEASISIDPGHNMLYGDLVCDITSAKLHVVYRELLTKDSLRVLACTATGASDWAGVADTMNPMGFLYGACSAVTDGFFYMVAVDEDSDAGYERAINYAAQFEDLYAFVTWQDNAKIFSAKTAAVSKYSDPLVAQFKKAWYAPVIEKEQIVFAYGNSFGAPLKSSSSILTAYKDSNDNLKMSSGVNIAVDGGVAVGDYVVIQTGEYDAEGVAITVRRKIEQILDNGVAFKVANPPLMTGPRLVHFVRERSNIEYANAIAGLASGINSERVNMVWCGGEVTVGGVAAPATVVAAILATTRAALPPHAPMTGLAVNGVTLNDIYKFTDVEYDVLNSGGVWVVANDSKDVATNYHQITTKTDGSVAEEDSCVSAGDAIVRELRNNLTTLTAGSVNVTDALIETIRVQIAAVVTGMMGRVYSPLYGPLIEGYEIVSLGRPASNNAAIVLQMSIDTPQPLLNGQLYFNIV